MEKNRPAYEKRVGSVRVAIWENDTEGKRWHNVSITRRYKQDDEWHETATFNGLGDLAHVGECVRLARAFIQEQDKAA